MNTQVDRRQFWKYLRRAMLIVAVLFILPHLVFVARFLASVVHNEITLRSFAEPFIDYPLPPDTVEIDRKMSWGTPGNGNGICAFGVTRVLQTTLEKDVIRDYHADVTIPVIVPGQSSSAAIDGLEGVTRVYLEFDEENPQIFRVSVSDGNYPGYACD